MTPLAKGWAWATHPPSPTESEPVTPHLFPTDPRAEVTASGPPLSNCSDAVTLWINTRPILSQNLCRITFWFWRLKPEMEKSRFHCQKSFNWGARQGWKAEKSRGNDSETAELRRTAEKSFGCCAVVYFFNEAVPRE